jgi:hypothetical protein
MKTASSLQRATRGRSRHWNWRTILPLLLSLASISFPAIVLAAPQRSDSIDKDVRPVICGSSNQPFSSINAALASLDPSEDDTIYVRGACKENVTITSFDRLKMIAQNGASISDASGGTLAVVTISDSTRVSLQGFTINGSGPNDQNDGIDCIASTCSFSGNTVQSAADGVNIFWGGRAFFDGDVIQNNTGYGIFVVQSTFALADRVTVQSNAGSGIFLSAGAVLQLNNSAVQNNAGNGIEVRSHATLELGHVGVQGSSITANQGAGMLVMDLSFARFSPGVSNIVKNNLGGTDVLCSPQFPATRGALTNIGGGTTNCVEP